MEPGETEESAIRLDEFGLSKTSETRAQFYFQTSPRELRTKKPSWAPIKSLTEGSPGGVPIEVQRIQQAQADLPDTVLLYRTLVADGGLPPGFEAEFSTLGPTLGSAAQRQGRRIRELSNLGAAVLLRQPKALGEKHAKAVKSSADQFLQAAEMPPRRYKSRLQRTLYAGPTKEEKERARWVEILGSMLVHTPTPLGRILMERPGSIQLLGAGRRPSTLRSRVRAVRRYLNWLALNHDLGYPRELDHVTCYLLARQAEPCTGNALRGAHTAIAFIEDVAGVEQSEKVTGTQVYAIFQKEILANTLPSRPVKQAPRMLVGIISMLENLVVSESTSVYHRIYAWWILVQSWGILRFDDHRGIKPQDVSLVGGSLSARLTRSKTLGSDRSVGSRQFFINAPCFVERRERLHEGWRVLCTAANFDRDYLLPSPTTNCNGCLPS